MGYVSGHDFTVCWKTRRNHCFVTRAWLQPGRKYNKMSVGLQPCAMLFHDLAFFSKLFSRANTD